MCILMYYRNRMMNKVVSAVSSNTFQKKYYVIFRTSYKNVIHSFINRKLMNHRYLNIYCIYLHPAAAIWNQNPIWLLDFIQMWHQFALRAKKKSLEVANANILSNASIVYTYNKCIKLRFNQRIGKYDFSLLPHTCLMVIRI